MLMRKYKISPHTLKKVFLCLIFLFFLSPVIALATPAQTSDKVLRVGVPVAEPFVIVAPDGSYHGIAVDTWKRLAKNLNIQYQFVPMGEHIDDDIQQLAQGRVDMMVGALTPTEKRTELVDFTKPYYVSHVGIVVHREPVSFFHTLYDVVTSSWSWSLLFILALFILYLHIFWFFERRTGFKDISKNYWEGITTVYWLHTLRISFPQIPTHHYTRVFRMIWFFAVILFLSTVTATITSALTVTLSNNYVKYDKLSDFNGKTIAAVTGTLPFAHAVATGLHVIPAQSRDEAMQLLLTKKVVGVADYRSTADYYLQKHQLSNQLILADAFISQNSFAFALPINSPLMHPINVELRNLQANGYVRFLCRNRLGPQDVRNCEI